MYQRVRSLALASAILSASTSVAPTARAQGSYTPTAANLKARTWFQDAKFGMFIHWGVYSVLGDGEWLMETRPIHRTDYSKLPNFFNPTKFGQLSAIASNVPALTDTAARPGM